MARTTTRDVRLANRADLLRVLWSCSGMSRIELARRTALSPATVTNLVGMLLDEGLVAETGAMQRSVGRPATRVQLDPRARAVVGVEVRDCAVAVRLLDLRLTALGAVDVPFEAGDPTGQVCADAISTATHRLLREAAIPSSAVVGIGIAVPGMVTVDGCPRVHVPRLGWDAVALGALVSDGTGVPTYVENDAKALGFQEALAAAAGEDDVIVCLLGTGVGASVIVDGALLRGSSGSAGEWGHTTAVVGGARCSCGADGCLEAYVGAPAIVRRWQEAGGEDAGLEASIEALARGAAADDPVAIAVLRDTARFIGVGIADLINLLNPRRVLIAGWVGVELGPSLLPFIRQEARSAALSPPHAFVSIEVGTSRGDAIPAAVATLVVDRFLTAGGVTSV